MSRADELAKQRLIRRKSNPVQNKLLGIRISTSAANILRNNQETTKVTNGKTGKESRRQENLGQTASRVILEWDEMVQEADERLAGSEKK